MGPVCPRASLTLPVVVGYRFRAMDGAMQEKHLTDRVTLSGVRGCFTVAALRLSKIAHPLSAPHIPHITLSWNFQRPERLSGVPLPVSRLPVGSSLFSAEKTVGHMGKFDRQVPAVEYLAECSDAALQDFILQRMARASVLRKQLGETQEDLTSALAEAELAAWLLRHRRALKRPVARITRGAHECKQSA